MEKTYKIPMMENPTSTAGVGGCECTETAGIFKVAVAGETIRNVKVHGESWISFGKPEDRMNAASGGNIAARHF